MVNTHLWLSMRHFTTNEYQQGIYMGQQPYPICDTNIITNSLLEKIEHCVIYASTLLRSKQTVDYVLSSFRNTHFDVLYSNDLIERGLGDFEGKPKKIVRQNPDFFIDNKFMVELTPPNGESFRDFRERVTQILEDISKTYYSSNVLVISHLQVLRMIHFCMLKSNDYSHWHDVNYIHGEVVEETYGKE